jgi:hypothetical protein
MQNLLGYRLIKKEGRKEKTKRIRGTKIIGQWLCQN